MLTPNSDNKRKPNFDKPDNQNSTRTNVGSKSKSVPLTSASESKSTKIGFARTVTTLEENVTYKGIIKEIDVKENRSGTSQIMPAKIQLEGTKTVFQTTIAISIENGLAEC